jgi:hypothetical protein
MTNAPNTKAKAIATAINTGRKDMFLPSEEKWRRSGLQRTRKNTPTTPLYHFGISGTERGGTLMVMVQKGQNDHSTHADDDEHSCQDERHPQQHSLEWVQLKSRNCHIASFFQDRSETTAKP